MKRTIYNHYDIDDIKKMILDALQSYGAVNKKDLDNYSTKKDMIDFKDTILQELKTIRDNQELITGYKDQIEEHDVRIEHIEKHLHLAQPD